jgi:hypothetical protein
VRALHVAVLAVLVATPAGAARDCLVPLRENTRWACHAELSTGASVDFCTEVTNIFGEDPSARFFKMTSTGPYLATCSCQTRGKTGFAADSSYLCSDQGTGTTITGKVSKRKIEGQTLNVSADVRSLFRCEPDPSCDVQTVVDADLPPDVGSATVPPGQQVRRFASAGGAVDIGYIPGCAGFTTEAPTFVFEIADAAPGQFELFFVRTGGTAQGGLVISPSGDASCDPGKVTVPARPGSYRVWIATQSPELVLQGEVFGRYDLD